MKPKTARWITPHIGAALQGKTVAITGATDSLGFALAEEAGLCKAKLVLVGRNPIALSRLEADLKAKGHDVIGTAIVNLSSANSVSQGIKHLSSFPLDILVNNAGLYHQSFGLIDGYEKTFYINYFMPQKLSLGLLPVFPTLKIVNVVSATYNLTKVDFTAFERKKTKNKTLRYAKTKWLATASSLALIQKGADVVLAHPGGSLTNRLNPKNHAYSKTFYRFVAPLAKHFLMPPEKVALSLLWGMAKTPKPDRSFGPRGWLHLWGYPTEYAYSKSLSNPSGIQMVYDSSLALLAEMSRKSR